MQRFLKQKNNRLIMQSKCTACGIKKSRFMKKNEAKGFIEQFRNSNKTEQNSIVRGYFTFKYKEIKYKK